MSHSSLILPAFESCDVIPQEVAQRADRLANDYGVHASPSDYAIRLTVGSNRMVQRCEPDHLVSPFLWQDDFWDAMAPLYEAVEPHLAHFGTLGDGLIDLIDYRRDILKPNAVQGMPGWHFDLFGKFVGVSFVVLDKPEYAEQLTTRNAVGELSKKQANLLLDAKAIDVRQYQQTSHFPNVNELTKRLLEKRLLRKRALALRQPAPRSGELMRHDERHLHSTAINTTNVTVTRSLFRLIRQVPGSFDGTS